MTLRPILLPFAFGRSLALTPALLFLSLTSLTSLTACNGLGSDDAGSDFVSGNLGQAAFSYTCIDATDSACAGTSTFTSASTDGADSGADTSEITPSGAYSPTFPVAIAVGSEFRLTYDGVAENGSPLQTPTSSSVGSGVFKTVTDTYLQPVGSGPSDFRAIAAGYAGVYIENTVDSQLVDYTLLHLVTVDALSLGDSKLTPLGSTFALTGKSATVFTVTPLHDNAAVAGAIDLEWTVDDPLLVSLTTPNPTARMSVTPRAAGKTTLHVSGLGQTTSIALTVSP